MTNRCLYCGIKLKINIKAKVIRHCPACSMGLEADAAHYPVQSPPREESLMRRGEKELPAHRRSTAILPWQA